MRYAEDPGRATREYLIERDGALLEVFGGKWTTARARSGGVNGLLLCFAGCVLPGGIYGFCPGFVPARQRFGPARRHPNLE